MTWKKYNSITRFSPGEFHENPEEHADIFFMRQLDAFAVALESSVFPSPAPGSLARFDGSRTSRHYAVGRQSDACDIFCNCPITKAWTTALQFFTGVGVYFDTRFRGGPWPMLHVDMRPRALVWYRDDGVYQYPGEDDFYQELFDLLDKPVTMMVRP